MKKRIWVKKFKKYLLYVAFIFFVLICSYSLYTFEDVSVSSEVEAESESFAVSSEVEIESDSIESRFLRFLFIMIFLAVNLGVIIRKICNIKEKIEKELL